MSGIKFKIDQTHPVVLDPKLMTKSSKSGEKFSTEVYGNVPVTSHLNFDAQVQSSDGDSPEDPDFSDGVLKYINDILMEEDLEDKTCMFKESAALQAAEKSLYEVIGEPYPVSEDCHRVPGFEIPDEKRVGVISDCCLSEAFCPEWNSDLNPNKFYRHQDTVGVASQSLSGWYYSSSNGIRNIADGPINSPVSIFKPPDCQSAMPFKKGVEDASNFFPTRRTLVVDSRHNEPLGKVQNEVFINLPVEVDQRIDNDIFVVASQGKKNPYPESTGSQEERSNKQSAVHTESNVRAEMFDTVLLCSQGRNQSALRKELSEVTKNTLHNNQANRSNDRKKGGEKKGGKKNVVDMGALLTLCAQAVAAGDYRTANQFLKQIREHANPTGDGMQRLAYYFAGGLEARMAGSGTKIYMSLINLPTSAADILKAYHIYLTTCPFRKISNFFANQTIRNVAEKATRLHIIDFGILYGFQWPSFIQHLSSRPGGPPKLRVTGIDLPCPGFRPSERVEETGRRLASYAESFQVPFEFNAIAQKWETIKLDDLKIDKDEALVVNCLYRFRNLLDETVIVNSPRNMVLNLIKKANPAVFVLAIVNGAYNAPFFITRFREALFHYSSLFDMLDVNIPREIHERSLLERTLVGWEAMNVIACEGVERIERPETYKQWQVRMVRAGFKQLPLDNDIMKKARNRVKLSYHKDFVIDRDDYWLLQGWKGRIVYALSSWRRAY